MRKTYNIKVGDRVRVDCKHGTYIVGVIREVSDEYGFSIRGQDQAGQPQSSWMAWPHQVPTLERRITRLEAS